LFESETFFEIIRSNLLNKPTVAEHQIASRIAKTIDLHGNNTEDDPLVKRRLAKTSKWINNLIIHYTHENRFESSKKDIHELWDHVFTNTPVMNTKLVIGNRNNPNITKALVRRNPRHKSSTNTTTLPSKKTAYKKK
jgi:hypothetical protein